LERTQQADDPEERQSTTFRVLKDRYTGRSAGKTIDLGYDSETGRLYVKGNPAPFTNETSSTTSKRKEDF